MKYLRRHCCDATRSVRYNHLLISVSNFQINVVCYTLKSVFQEVGSAKGCQVFRETKMRNDGRVLLAGLNLYVRFNISVTTFDTNHSVTASTQTFRCFNPEAS